MQKRYYLDTCIWMDYFGNRCDKFKPLGEWAFMCLKHMITTGCLVIYSQITLRELQKYFSDKQIEVMFNIVKSENLLLEANINNEQKKEAALLAKSRDIPAGDAIHAIIARDNNAILITRDAHFEKLIDICKVISPEELF